LEKYNETTAATTIKTKNQQNEHEVIRDNIIKELDKKREVAINKKNKDQLRDEVSIYRLAENILNYIHFISRELTGKSY
jgi:hypothetical protein